MQWVFGLVLLPRTRHLFQIYRISSRKYLAVKPAEGRENEGLLLVGIVSEGERERAVTSEHCFQRERNCLPSRGTWTPYPA